MQDVEKLNNLGYKTQATPREINLFYLQPGQRERIVLENGAYHVLNTELTFTREAILEEIDNHPERFSPNVVLRPLYQEMVLPNLAYVGGGGELAYWLERKSLFEHFETPFPILIRRHSVMWVDRDSVKKKVKFNLDAADLFRDTDTLIREYISANAEAEVSLAAEMEEIERMFEKLATKAAIIDPTLEKAVLADAVKYRSGLEQWQSRLMHAEKQKHEVALQQIRNLIDKFCPGGGLQERYDNFIPYLLKYGDNFVETLVQQLDSFDNGFVVLEDMGEIVS
jgi:bacillithiol biosynthesis cysteine-adding enzyme BshC